MAVTRIQSISVTESLLPAIKHRLDPGPNERVILHKALSYECSDDMHNELSEIAKNSDNCALAYKEMFEYIESAAYKKKIRKNSVIQEIVISYHPKDFDTDNEDEILKSIHDDILIFLGTFKEKFGFYPFTTYFIHVNDSGIYHTHILFSLMNYNAPKPVKARWKKRTYFDLIKKMSKYTKIKTTDKTKGIGAYPLWLLKKLEKQYGREATKKIVELARKKGYTTRELIENADALFKNNQTTKIASKNSIQPS
jgi:hypothetical protein